MQNQGFEAYGNRFTAVTMKNINLIYIIVSENTIKHIYYTREQINGYFGYRASFTSKIKALSVANPTVTAWLPRLLHGGLYDTGS